MSGIISRVRLRGRVIFLFPRPIKSIFLLFVCLSILLTSSSSNSDTPLSISAVTLLLPPSIVTVTSSYSVIHPLHAYGGCFHWSNTDPSLLSLHPDPSSACHSHGQHGHTSVLLTPTLSSASLPSASPSSPSRRTIHISASPLHSPTTSLYCEVFLDHISSLSLLTSTRRVTTGEEETLSVQAVDSFQNTFSSVEGLPFQWSVSDPSVLSLRGLREAGVNVSRKLLEMEEGGKRSSMIVVQGMASGKAQVKAEMEGGERVRAEVDLTVLEPLMLQPHHSIVLPASVFHLLAFTRVREGREGLQVKKVITLPSPLYHFTHSGEAVSVTDGGKVMARQVGRAEVQMRDKWDEQREEATIEVTEAVRIEGRLIRREGKDEVERGGEEMGREAGKGWWVRERSDYQVVVRLKDSKGRVMDIAPNVHIAVKVEEDSISTPSSSLSSLSSPSTSSFTLLPLSAKRVGQSTLLLSLSPVRSDNVSYSSPVMTRLPITVTSAVTISPSHLLLPASPSPLPYPLILSGGSGQYSLSSSSPSLTTTASSLLPLSPCSAIVTAVDSSDPDNSATSSVEVAEAGRLHVRGGSREVEVGEEVELIVEVTDTDSRQFSDCQSLRLEISQAGVAFEGEEEAAQAQCEGGKWKLRLRAVKPGRSGLTLQVKDIPSTSIPLLLSAFKPATFSEQHYVAGEGSTVSLVVKDGPITPPKESADLRVTAYEVKGGKEGWKEVEGRVKKVWEDEEPSLPSLLSPAKRVRVKAQPLGGKGGLRESSVMCEAGSHGEYLIVADLSHAASPSLPSPVHNRAFTWLSCYPPLILSPPSLSLGIGEKQQISSLTPSSSSHPLYSSLYFSSSNPHVASVSPTGLVYATSLGRTIIRATVPRAYAGKEDTLEAEVEVEVKFEDFVIIKAGRGLVEGGSMLLHVEGKNGEVPGDDIFESVKVEWSTESDGISLLPPLSPPSPSTSPVIGYSVMVIGKTVGNHTVKARVTVGASSAFPHGSTLSYSASVEVVQELSLCSSGSLLLTFSGTVKLSTLPLVSSPSLSYRLLTFNSSSPPFYLSSSAITARSASSSIDTGDDAALVISSSIDGHVQSATLSLSLRPLRQLAVGGIGLRRWLCVGESYEVEVRGADGLGRLFDGEGGGLELEVILSKRTVLKSEVRSKSERGRRVKIVKLTVLPHKTEAVYTSVIVRVGLKEESVMPVYLQLFVSSLPSSSCPSSPSAALISFHFPLSYSTYPLKTQKRRDLAVRLHSDLVSSLSISPSSLRILSIDPSTQQVKALILPSSHSTRHPHQWFLTSSSSDSPMDLAYRLQAQLKDEKSAWRKSNTGSEADVKRGLSISSIPFNPDEPVPSAVWMDEKEVNEWEESHAIPSRSASSPPSSPNTSDPYEMIARRIEEAFQSPGASSAWHETLAYVATTVAGVGGAVYLLYRWRVRGLKFPPSFWLWLREGVEGVWKGRAGIVPVQGEVGRGLRQQAQVIVG